MHWKTVESTNMIEIIMIGVTDLKMPKLNGQEEYLKIRQKNFNSTTMHSPSGRAFLVSGRS